MKIEATPEEIAELVTELQTRLMDCTMELDNENLEEAILKMSDEKRP